MINSIQNYVSEMHELSLVHHIASYDTATLPIASALLIKAQFASWNLQIGYPVYVYCNCNLSNIKEQLIVMVHAVAD
jgi:hypothetical protein